MKILIRRGGSEYGPYTLSQVETYLGQGRVFLHDLAREEQSSHEPGMTLHKLLQQTGNAGLLKSRWFGKGTGFAFVWPWQEIRGMGWVKNGRLIGLATIGLTPAAALAVSDSEYMAYWAIALYVSALWAVFFYALFRTPQTRALHGVLSFFWTGVVSIPLLLTVQNLPLITHFLELSDAEPWPVRLVGMFLGVGLIEELSKLAIVVWLTGRPGIILQPQTAVLYGMLSGLGFGIYEGVAYQTLVNREQGVDAAYFLNVARLTTLPFLHAIWTGIAAYFAAFAALFPVCRHGLYLSGLVVSAGLHATYNTFGWTPLGLAAAVLGVILLMIYLANSQGTQQQLQL